MRREKELERVKRNCINGEEAVKIVPLDLTKPETFRAAAEEAREFKGRIDILVNNGGVSQRALAAEATMESVRRVMEINFVGTAGLTKEVRAEMIERQRGDSMMRASGKGTTR